MTDYAASAQLQLLADLLLTPIERISHLERLGARNLGELRERIADQVYESQREQVAIITKVAPLVPDPVVATLATKVVGPQVAAAVANTMALDHPDRLNGLMRRLPIAFVAQTLRYLDPKTVPTLSQVVPLRVWAPAVRRLLKAGEYAIAATLVEKASVDLLLAVEREVDDAEAIVCTLAYTNDSEKLEQLLDALPADRLVRLVDNFGTGSAEMIMAGFSTLTRISPPGRKKLAELLVDQLDDDGITRFVKTVEAAGGRDELRELVEANLDGARLARALAALDGQLV